MLLSLGSKSVFVNICPIFTGLIKKSCLKKSKFSSEFSPFKHVKKNNLSEYLVLFSEIGRFGLKREVLCEFPQKCFNTKKKDSLAICGFFGGEKQFLLIFPPF